MRLLIIFICISWWDGVYCHDLKGDHIDFIKELKEPTIIVVENNLICSGCISDLSNELATKFRKKSVFVVAQDKGILENRFTYNRWALKNAAIVPFFFADLKELQNKPSPFVLIYNKGEFTEIQLKELLNESNRIPKKTKILIDKCLQK